MCLLSVRWARFVPRERRPARAATKLPEYWLNRRQVVPGFSLFGREFSAEFRGEIKFTIALQRSSFLIYLKTTTCLISFESVGFRGFTEWVIRETLYSVI